MTTDPAAAPPPNTDPAQGDPPGPGAAGRPGARLGADWWAVIVAAVLVVLALSGLLPSIPFLVK